MKKQICLLLTMLLLLCLCACTKETPADPEAEALAAADALLQAGDYEAAIQAYSDIGTYQTIAARIAEAEQKLAEQKQAEEEASLGFLFGTWKDLNSEAVITFRENNQAVLVENGYDGTQQSYEMVYEKREGELYLTFFNGAVPVEERDGVTHLNARAYGGQSYDFVTEAAYETLGPEMVTVTMENWQEYFEIVSFPGWTENDFGETDGFEWITALYIREEYADRVVWDLSNAAFGYTRDMHARSCTVDFEKQTVTLGGSRHRWDDDVSQTVAVPPMYAYDSFPGMLYILHSCRWSESDENQIPFVWDDIKVTRVEGSLAIKAQ